MSIPYAQGEEKAVISVLWKYPEKLDDAAHLTPDHFHFPANRMLFEHITGTIDRGDDLEFVSFTRKLHEAGILENLGGPAGLTEVFTYAPNAAHFNGHLKALTAKLALRQAQQLSGAILEAIAENKESEEVADMVATRSTIITDTLAEAKPSSDTKSLLRASAQRWADMCTGKSDPMGIETSLVEINQLFRGLKDRRVTVISGLPAQGKSLLADQLLMDAVSQNFNGLLLSWEMDESEVIERCIALDARLPFDAISDPLKYAKEVLGLDGPSKEMVARVQRAYKDVSGYPLTIRAMHGQNITQAIATIRREHRKMPLRVVVLDFIQRIGASRHMEKQPYERQLTDIADRFQNLAQELGFHGIVLSQLNKDGAAKHAEAINESCALHLKIVAVPETGRDGTPLTDEDGNVKIKRRGLGVMKDRFHGQTGNLLAIGLNRQIQRFERIETN